MRQGILCGSSSTPSCKIIRDCLEQITGNRFLITHNPRKISQKVIFRYGNMEEFHGEDTEYNSPSVIKLLSNKLYLSELLKENDVPTVEFFSSGIPQTYPVLIRKTLCGFGGAGIIPIYNQEEFNQQWRTGFFWTPYIKKTAEVRVHVLDGKVAKIFKKQFDTDLEISINHNQNSHFSLRENQSHPRLVELIENKIAPLINGKFYGLDLGWSNEKKWFVFEGNSAPGINESTGILYAQLIADSL